MKCRDKTKIEKYMRQLENVSARHYSDSDFRSADLAKEMAVSLRQLQRVLKADDKPSPNEFLKTFRLKKAFKMCLKSRDITGVALSCGFSSPAYFTQCFKAHYGYLPSQLRSAYQEDGHSKTRFFKRLKKLKSEVKFDNA